MKAKSYFTFESKWSYRLIIDPGKKDSALRQIPIAIAIFF